MRKVVIWTAMLALVFGGTVYGYTAASSTRTDCPGKIICPITGHEVCKDQCPLADAARDDCPGKAQCPIDGDLVCRDHCPLENVEKQTKRSCCQGR